MLRDKLLALFLCVLLLLPNIAYADAVLTDAVFTPPDGYAVCTENASWALYLCEDNLGLIMLHKATGRAMYSCVSDPDQYPGNAQWKALYTSGIVMDYLKGTVIEPLRADFTYMQNEKTFVYDAHGFTCDAYFPELQLGFSVRVQLTENDLCVEIPLDSLRQDDEENYAINAFYVYPFMGSSYMGQNGGYMLIPDGQGAIIELKDNEGRYSSPFTATVYGSNIGLAPITTGAVYNNASTNNSPERIMMPVFGMAHKDSALAYLSVIEQGDDNALIEANCNGVSNLPFDWVYAKYTYRVVYAQQTGPSSGTVNRRLPHINQFNIKQHFYFLTGEAANYCGMAHAYGEYLEQHGLLASAAPVDDFSVEVDFFGTENENGMLGTQAVTMTTARQMADILSDLQARGVDDITSVVYGWCRNGYTGGLPITGYHVSGAVGGRDGMQVLYQRARENGVTLYLDTDPFSMTLDTAGMLKYSALKRVDSSTFAMPMYAWVYDTFQYLTPTKMLEVSRKLAKEFLAADVPGVSLSGYPNVLTAYYEQDTYHDKTRCRAVFEEATDVMRNALPTMLFNANAYLWKYAHALTYMPVAGSDYIYTSDEVPFMAIALSGRIPVYTEYTNFQANTRRFFLKLVEQGTRPSFLITWEDPIELSETNANWVYSSKYDLYAEMIEAWYTELKSLHALIDGASIIKHQNEGGLVTVKYDNGLTIYINYGDKPVTAGGQALEALSYKAVTNDGE